MNQKDKLEQVTINILDENVNTDKLKTEIEFTKKLLGKGFNKNNYINKSETQLKTILNNYKQEYKNSNNPKYGVYITLVNSLTNSGKVGWLDDYSDITPSKYECKLFNYKEEADKAIKEYKFNVDNDEGYSIYTLEVRKL